MEKCYNVGRRWPLRFASILIPNAFVIIRGAPIPIFMVFGEVSILALVVIAGKILGAK